MIIPSSNGAAKKKPKMYQKSYTTLFRFHKSPMSQQTQLLVSLFESFKFSVHELRFIHLYVCLFSSLGIPTDVIGVCSKFGELQDGESKTTGRKYKKRDITLIDKS